MLSRVPQAGLSTKGSFREGGSAADNYPSELLPHLAWKYQGYLQASSAPWEAGGHRSVVLLELTRVWLCGCGGKGSGQTHLCRKERVAQFCWAGPGWPITLLWMASSPQLFPPRPVLSWILGATQSPYLPLRVRDFEEPLFPWSLTYMIMDSPH